jgi:hypothetical protein
MIEPSIDRLTSLPRFVLAISPQRYDAQRLSIEQLLRMVSSSTVDVGGWSFPYVEHDCISSGPGESYIVSNTDFGASSYHLEQWRFYRSGQFAFRMMPPEVADSNYQESTWAHFQRRHPQRHYVKRPLGLISFMTLIRTVTAAYLFASRLTQEVPFDTSIDMRLRICGVKDWALGSAESSRPLYDLYMSSYDTLESYESIPLDMLVGNPIAAAVPAIASLFRQFAWMHPPTPDVIAQHQRSLFRWASQ